MKLFRRSLLLMAELAAFGWFIIRDISFCAALYLIPLGVAFYYLHKLERVLWLNGALSVCTAVIAAYIVSCGLYEKQGFLMALFLMAALALGASKLPREEWARISGWWMCAFLLIFVLMLVATLPGIKFSLNFGKPMDWLDLLIFYFLAFAEPLAMGREYRAAPLALGMVLAPFGIAGFLALGAEAFEKAEYAYLSVWSGVSVSAFHHLEGVILSFYFGAAALRAAHFISETAAKHRKKALVKK